MDILNINGPQEFDKNDNYDVFYAELERQMLILIDDHDNGGLFENTTKKHSSSSWNTNRRTNNIVKQPSNYFCWNDGDERLVPSSIARLWENNNKGTGVFIPRNVNSRVKNKPRRKSYNVYKPVGIKGIS
ncbi:hypothetical protein OSB04_008899 [Centaurea solstitialis]|uniref:Uncharacterized protein n=1 Tax=Centaurea solstitialis TaxID=347529 RepID=A0AA38TPD8_9ASTR|nr:hypothetical protein OSB04_008899 [Centaurea solstitialis]